MTRTKWTAIGSVIMFATGTGAALIGCSPNSQQEPTQEMSRSDVQVDNDSEKSADVHSNLVALSVPDPEKVFVTPHSHGFWELSVQLQRERVFLYMVASPWKCGWWGSSVPQQLVNQEQSLAALLKAMTAGGNVRVAQVRNTVGLHCLFYQPAPDEQFEKLRQAIASDDAKIRQKLLGQSFVHYDPRMVHILAPSLSSKDKKSLARSLLRTYLGVVPTVLMLPQAEAAHFLEIEYKSGNRLHAVAGLGAIGGDESLRLLEEATKSDDKQLRIAAVQALRFIGTDKARSVLETMVADQDIAVRKAVAEAFSWFEGPPARSVLKKLIADKDSGVRSSATRALAWHGAVANRILAHAMQDKALEVRQAAVISLGKTGGQDAVDMLDTALRDEDQYVRDRASESLARIGGPAVLAVLEKAVHDESTTIRWIVAGTLDQIGGDESLRLLKVLLNDSDLYVRARAVYHLGSFQADRVHSLLKRATERDECCHIQSAAASALGKIGGDESVAMLSELLDKNTREDYHHVRRGIAYSLGRIGTDTAVRRLKKMLEEEQSSDGADKNETWQDLSVRRSAINALGVSRSKKAIPLLKVELDHNDRQTRGEAIAALGRIGGAETLDLLIAHLDTTPKDKEMVHRTLQDLYIADEKVRRILGLSN